MVAGLNSIKFHRRCSTSSPLSHIFTAYYLLNFKCLPLKQALTLYYEINELQTFSLKLFPVIITLIILPILSTISENTNDYRKKNLTSTK